MFTFTTSSVFIASSLVIIIYIIITKVVKSTNLSTNLPPGSFGWPIIGETLELLGAGRGGHPEKYVQDRMKKYNSKIFRTSLLGERMIAFCGPAGHKFLYGNENKLVNQWWPKSTQMLLSSSLLTLVGDEAKRVRRMLMSFLGPDSMGRYIKTVDIVTQRHIQTSWAGNKEVMVYQAAKLYTFELACRLFIGIDDPDHITKLEQHFDVFLKGFISIAFNFPGTRFYSSMRAAKAIRNELQVISRKRRVELEQKIRLPSEDLLSYLLATPDENDKFFTWVEIESNLLMLLFGGHTASSVITVIMKYLAEMPDVFQNIFKEQLDIASSKEEGCLLEWEDLHKMKYTWNVVSEILRLSPPVTGSFRQTIVEFPYEGYTIPKGWKLYWSPCSTNRDPLYFPNEAKFDATRFEGIGPAPYAFVPFGGGPRMCLGQDYARVQVLVFMHNMVKRYKWSLVDPTEKLEFDPMPSPVNGLPVLLQSHS